MEKQTNKKILTCKITGTLTVSSRRPVGAGVSVLLPSNHGPVGVRGNSSNQLEDFPLLISELSQLENLHAACRAKMAALTACPLSPKPAWDVDSLQIHLCWASPPLRKLDLSRLSLDRFRKKTQRYSVFSLFTACKILTTLTKGGPCERRSS